NPQSAPQASVPKSSVPPDTLAHVAPPNGVPRPQSSPGPTTPLPHVRLVASPVASAVVRSATFAVMELCTSLASPVVGQPPPLSIAFCSAPCHCAENLVVHLVTAAP